MFWLSYCRCKCWHCESEMSFVIHSYVYVTQASKIWTMLDNPSWIKFWAFWQKGVNYFRFSVDAILLTWQTPTILWKQTNKQTNKVHLRPPIWLVCKLHACDWWTLHCCYLGQNETFWDAFDGFIKRSRLQTAQDAM